MFVSNWKSALLLNIHDKSNLYFILLFKNYQLDIHIYGVFYLTEMIEMGIKSELDELIEEDAGIEWP